MHRKGKRVKTVGLSINDTSFPTGDRRDQCGRCSSTLRFDLGCEQVNIVYRRSREEMPAYPEEIEEALDEGVHIHYLTAPVSIKGEKGRVTGLDCIKTELGDPDASGRRRPVPVEGSEFVIPCDTVIPAIGQKPDLSWAIDEWTFETTRQNTTTYLFF